MITHLKIERRGKGEEGVKFSNLAIGQLLQFLKTTYFE